LQPGFSPGLLGELKFACKLNRLLKNLRFALYRAFQIGFLPLAAAAERRPTSANRFVRPLGF
jgi:hypothetical protein